MVPESSTPVNTISSLSPEAVHNTEGFAISENLNDPLFDSATTKPPSLKRPRELSNSSDANSCYQFSQRLFDNFLKQYDLHNAQIENDDILLDAEHITPEELALRQTLKLQRLRQLYTEQFHVLQDDFLTLYSSFVSEHLNSLKSIAPPLAETLPEMGEISFFRLVDQMLNTNPSSPAVDASENSLAISSGPPPLLKLALYPCGYSDLSTHFRSDIANCTIESCPGKRIRPTEFCFAHLMHDPNQKLFKSCEHVLAQSSSGLPLKYCGYPIFITRTPSYCNAHLDLHSDHISRKTGLSRSIRSKKPRPLSPPPTPQYHDHSDIVN